MRVRIALVLFGLALALVIVEGGLRLFDRFRCFDSTSSLFYEPNRLYGWAHVPGDSGWAKRCIGPTVEWQSHVHINSRGLRDREIPYARGDAYRILVLGDSYTEGLQVGDDETFSKQLERRLNALHSRPVEVVNGGHAAYGTDNELLFYRYEGRKYRPDLVLLVFNTENDVLENYTPLLRQTSFPYPAKPYFLFEDGRLVAEEFPMPEPRGRRAIVEGVRLWLNRHSVTYRLLRTLNVPGVAHASGEPPRFPGQLGVLLKRYPPEWEAAWRVTRALVRHLRHAASRDGARFAVVVMNGGYEVSERRWRAKLYLLRQPPELYDPTKADRLANRFLRRERIPHLALLPVFQAHLKQTASDGYWRWDPHWTLEGHTLAAEAIARWLDDLGRFAGDDLTGRARPATP